MLGAVTVTPWATPPCSSPPEHPSFHTQLNPILPDLEYLGDQHLLLSVKGVESYESYGAWGTVALGCCCLRREPTPVYAVPTGECCIAMRSLVSSLAQQFETFLSHRGEETGSIRGWVKVRVPTDRRSTRERLYGNGGRALAPSHRPGQGGSGTPPGTVWCVRFPAGRGQTLVPLQSGSALRRRRRMLSPWQTPHHAPHPPQSTPGTPARLSPPKPARG